jgi:hypothetical protein
MMVKSDLPWLLKARPEVQKNFRSLPTRKNVSASATNSPNKAEPPPPTTNITIQSSAEIFSFEVAARASLHQAMSRGNVWGDLETQGPEKNPVPRSEITKITKEQKPKQNNRRIDY